MTKPAVPKLEMISESASACVDGSCIIEPDTMAAPDLAQRLRSRRDELVSELERLTEPPPTGASISFGKRVGDGTTEAVERISSTAAARSITTSIADIDSALAAIEAGTYGECEVCGRAIPPERLEARPATTRCVDCA